MNKIASIPDDYFTNKDAVKYKFNILKDIILSEKLKKVEYDEILDSDVFAFYSKYNDINLYVHFPWCIEKCTFCYYYVGKFMNVKKVQATLDAVKKHAYIFNDNIGMLNKNIKTIYFGGGTPTTIPLALLEEILSFFNDLYNPKKNCEFTCEASIITLKPKKIALLKKYINRLSIGIQSFDNNLLKQIGRLHTAEKSIDVLKTIIPEFPCVNIDLIYGLPNQTLTTFLDSVEKAISLNAQSFTIYRLDLRETPAMIQNFKENPKIFPGEIDCQIMYKEAKKMFYQAGYVENLIGWFLRPPVQDTLVYRERWQKQNPCIALGPGVNNYAADFFYETILDNEQYKASIDINKLPISNLYEMNLKVQLIWYILAQWKSNSPLYKERVHSKFGVDLFNHLVKTVDDYIKWGVIIDFGDRMEISEEGKSFVEWILLEIVDRFAEF